MKSDSTELEQDDTDSGDSSDLNGGEVESGIVSSEPKKGINPTLLVMFVILVCGGGGLYFMHLKAGPAAASAASIETQAAQATINQFLTGGSKNIRAMQDAIKSTEVVVSQFLAYPAITQIPLDDLQTNPFRHTGLGAEKKVDEELERKKREDRRLAVLKAVQELQLQSIVIGGDRKACMVNNAMYREGQAVNGFTIEKISQASVIVRQDVYRFELKMQR